MKVLIILNAAFYNGSTILLTDSIILLRRVDFVVFTDQHIKNKPCEKKTKFTDKQPNT